MKILLTATNVGVYASGNLKTGLWLSELTHIYHRALEQGFEVTIASPKGGRVPVDPESLKPWVVDKLSKEYLENTEFMKLLENTPNLATVAEQNFDCVYLTGGHGTMYDFPNDTTLQRIVKNHYENSKVLAALCHGVAGLLNVKLSNGAYLIANKKITGFDWFEETLARRKNEVPFNLEAALKERGATYKKAFIPMTSNVVVDGNLITGQNPFSSKKMAEVVVQRLNKVIFF